MTFTRTIAFAVAALAVLAGPAPTPADAQRRGIGNGWELHQNGFVCFAGRDFDDGGYVSLDLSRTTDPFWDVSTVTVLSSRLPRYPRDEEPGGDTFYAASPYTDFYDASLGHFGLGAAIGGTAVLDTEEPATRFSIAEPGVPSGYTFHVRAFALLAALDDAESLDISAGGDTVLSIPLGGPEMTAALRRCVLEEREDRDEIAAEYPELAGS